jgi:hypothetical protein
MDQVVRQYPETEPVLSGDVRFLAVRPGRRGSSGTSSPIAAEGEDREDTTDFEGTLVDRVRQGTRS